jgi:uncharacterized protein YkwD
MAARSFLRSLVLTVVLFGCLAAPAVITHADAGTNYRFKRAEKCFMRRINRARVAHGLPKLDRDKQLSYVARIHAQEMAHYSSVWDDSMVGHRVTHWRSLGTNAGRGAGCHELTQAFLASWSHRENILGHFHFIGVGLIWYNGNMYVSQNFESRLNPGNIYRWP